MRRSQSISRMSGGETQLVQIVEHAKAHVRLDLCPKLFAPRLIEPITRLVFGIRRINSPQPPIINMKVEAMGMPRAPFL